MIVDLHSHTHCSDGHLSPQDVVYRASERGVSVLAITDHDTIAGLPIAHITAREVGIQLVNGIEFSSQWGRGGVHIVGLGIDPMAPAMQSAIAYQFDSRESRSRAIADRLAKAGIPNAYEGARELAGGESIGRPHFAQFLVNQGAVSNMNAAFKRFLGTGKYADVKYEWPSMEQVIEWIVQSGGIAVLAHPAKYDLTRMKMCAMIDSFAAAGGQAIEVISGQQLPTLTADLVKIANARSLMASCGSDFHFPDQPWQDLGNFGSLPDTAVPVWSALRLAS